MRMTVRLNTPIKGSRARRRGPRLRRAAEGTPPSQLPESEPEPASGEPGASASALRRAPDERQPAVQGFVRVGGADGVMDSDSGLGPALRRAVPTPAWTPPEPPARAPAPMLLLDRQSFGEAGQESPLLLGRMRAFEASMRVVQRLLEAGQLDAALDVIGGLNAVRRPPESVQAQEANLEEDEAELRQSTTPQKLDS